MSSIPVGSDFDNPACINDPRYWRERAQEAKAKAERMNDTVAKASMLEAVKHYDSLAALTELLLREGNYGATERLRDHAKPATFVAWQILRRWFRH